MHRYLVPLAIALALPALAAPATADEPRELIGALHEHSGYSDGWPGSRPADYYASARDGHDLNFLGSSEHETNLDLPIVLNEECVTNPAICLIADKVNPDDSFRKWEANAEQADAATDPAQDFTGFRGFEWSSDRQGHINVYFSGGYTRSAVDGGQVTVDAFYDWLARPTTLGGGSDGLAVFNHPGDKSLCGQIDACGPEDDPAFNWGDFRHVPKADPQMVGIEVFNGGSDFGSPPDHFAPPEGWYARALDRGWHVGAIGAEDKGHGRSDDWGGSQYAKTVILAGENTSTSIRAAMRRRSFYAVLDNALRLDFTVDGAPMGSRLARVEGKALAVRAEATAGAPVTLELVTSGGQVVASGDDVLSVSRAAAGFERWYFVRARREGKVVGYSSPVWIEPAERSAEWLAGDLHVHSCYSHDAYCPDIDGPPDEEIYTYGVSVGNRFQEAAARGLDYSAITDHGDLRSVDDPGFGAAGVIGLPGYENSLNGHAQMLGAEKIYDNGDSAAAAVNKEADHLRADGGVFQINHPGYRIGSPFSGCDTEPLHWTYGFDVKPDTIEVWNPTAPMLEAERYLDCWLDRGEHIGVTGGSDGHWTSTQAVGSGNPTTWVLSADRSPEGILAALRSGRTSISDVPPAMGGAPLLLEADADGDGDYEASMGDTAPGGTAMRVRSLSPSAAGVVRVRANGATLTESQLTPGGEVSFRAPAEPGWVRATLRAPVPGSETAPGCEPSEASISLCAYDSSMLGMTSPLYLGPRAVDQGVGAGTGGGAGTGAPTGARPGQGAATFSPQSTRRLLLSLSTAGRRTRGVLLRFKGLGFRAGCSRACRLKATVRTTGRRPMRLGSATAALPPLRTRRVRVPLARSDVAAALTPRRRRVLLLRVTVTDQGGRTQVARRTVRVPR